MTAATSPLENDSDLHRLERAISRHPTLLVAFSGGVDSALLAVVAHRLLGNAMIAVTADSSSMPRRELAEAGELCSSRSIPHLVVSTTELDRPEYLRNDRDRCYFCKQTLFLACESIARDRKIGAVAYGYTADDAVELRPGHRAAMELGVVAPLHEANLGKAAIRHLAAELELEIWDKPAAPCLSSRIPFGSVVSRRKLAAVEAVEELLHNLGFGICRARYDGRLMKLEVEVPALGRLAEPSIWAVIQRLALASGIERVVIDPNGFRSGSLSLVERFDDAT